MMTSRAALLLLVTDLKVSIAFSTRLPLAHSLPVAGADVARASWAFPVAGALVGLVGAITYWLAHSLRLPPLAAAVLTLTATLLVTGGLHEDGLADTADGFGGGKTRERKLEIMRDSRIGTFGTCALIVSLLLRAAALASLADPALVAPALMAAHIAARATMPMLMVLVPPARTEGLAADAGRPQRASVVAAALLAATTLVFGLGPVTAIIVALLLLSTIVFTAWLCVRQVGGQTGDILGAAEQAGEILILLAAAARA
jgi:adenosylcobinamide-GDP ribazoletransferase